MVVVYECWCATLGNLFKRARSAPSRKFAPATCHYRDVGVKFQEGAGKARHYSTVIHFTWIRDFSGMRFIPEQVSINK